MASTPKRRDGMIQTHWMDEARRQVGRGLDVLGLGPQETPYRVVAEWPGAKLRAYHDQERAHGPVLLIILAPFKRVYLWDLLPEVSVVRRCLDRGLRVYLLEWLIPTPREDEFGFADYADRLPGAALDAIQAETGVSAPVLAGHLSRACSWTSSRCRVVCSRRQSSSSTARTALCTARF